MYEYAWMAVGGQEQKKEGKGREKITREYAYGKSVTGEINTWIFSSRRVASLAPRIATFIRN